MKAVKWLSVPADGGCPVIRKTFSLSAPVSGEIRVTGLGWFALRINGSRVSDDLFTPALTDYQHRDPAQFLYPLNDETTHRIYYLRYDISPFLKNGENRLALQLAPGWFYQPDRTAEGRVDFSDCLLGWFDANIRCADGSTVQICSDGTERYFPSEITRSSLFLGEVHDMQSVSAEGHAVIPVPAPDAVFEQQHCPSDRVIRAVIPKLLGTVAGRRIYDTGENISGRVRVTLSAGRSVVVRYAEELAEDGSLDPFSTGAEGRLSTGEPQFQTDRFTAGDCSASFAAQFVWHGFRYFDILGDAEDVSVEVIHTDAPVISSFDSSSPVMNWLYEAYIRTQQSNLHNCIPTDCPHRERLGYTGDGQITAKAAMLCLNMRETYRKWIRDILDCQDIISGHVQHTAPLMGGGGGPGGWGCAIIILPDEYDRHYNDPTLLGQCYPQMLRFLDYLQTRCEGGLLVREEDGGWCLGDWASADEMQLPPAYVNSCFYLNALQRMERICIRTGHPEDILQFRMQIVTVSSAIRSEFLDRTSGSFCGGIQGADAFAVWAGLDTDGSAFSNLTERYRNIACFDTGFLGTAILMKILTDRRETDLLYRLFTAEKGCSYSLLMRSGATTLWEYLKPDCGSHSHPMFGAPVQQFFEAFGGITQAADSVGYEKLVIAPQLPKEMTYCSISCELPCGTVSVDWKKQSNAIEFTVSIPNGAKFDWNGSSRILSAGTHNFTVPDETGSNSFNRRTL